ncbi:MAG: hydratase, partial [Clostridiales bacterium]|nr:hydratase [Clostridiales bacterium]
MIKIHEAGGYAIHNRAVPASRAEGSGGKYTGGNGMPLSPDTRAEAKTRTIAYKILQSHHIKDENSSAGSLIDSPLRLRFDCLTSHDITYVGIIQTIRASRKDYSRFPMPYVLSNCHNSLCAVGGTINADDHAFGLSAAQKYGGVFVPPHRAV